jgi:hypothetical protein
MIARRVILGVIAGAAVALLGGCSILFPAKYRFRMTIDVQTPQGVRCASGVFAVWAANAFKLLPDEHARDWGVRGEAVILDLPDGPVFALLKTANLQRSDLALMSMAALDPQFENDVVESATRIDRSWSSQSGMVPAPDWPLMVRFGDINDPRSVEKVDPVAIGISRIMVETTSEQMTTGLGKRLGWLARLKGGYLSGRFSDDGSALGLTGGDFSTEVSK